MKRRIILVSIIVLVSLAGYTIIRVQTNEPPERELSIAKQMISEAALAESPRYAMAHYAEAERYYDSAMSEWSRENERFILFRNYRRIDEIAKKSSESSGMAIAGAKKNITKAEDVLEIRIILLGEKIKDFDEKFGRFPMISRHRDEIVKSKLQYSEGVLAFKNKKYTICESKLDSAETTLKRIFTLYEDQFNAYLNESPKWSEMVEKTIIHSKRNKVYCIVIDKLARECLLYKDGRILNRHTVELGVNWIGDKNQQGDKCTPEGFYKITDKKSNGQTRFYKALMLDYPNDDDRKRFLQNKKNGFIQPDANIGNLIEIHGHGGKGIDWTDGCIALENTDLDIIFKSCPIGTWVTIVGSTNSSNENSR